MPKQKSVYACTACGYESPRWQGQCPGCGSWNTLEEAIAAEPVRAAGAARRRNAAPRTGGRRSGVTAESSENRAP